MSSTGRVAPAVLMAALAATGACAGATYGSGVGDRLMEHPPWEAGRSDQSWRAVVHAPVTYQPGASQHEMFDPAGGRETAVAALLADMNAYLDAFGGTRPVRPVGPIRGQAPDVMFGCEADITGECLPWEIGRPQLRLAVGRPSGEWVRWVQEVLGDGETLLLITLEVGQYLPRQRNILGAKEVELGRDHRVSVPWLTSLETPVSVLQLTGALVDRDGRALRIGAEGLLARRTSLLASSVGLQALVTDEEVGQLRTGRRDDLPGRPLVWQAALRNLVGGLLLEHP